MSLVGERLRTSGQNDDAGFSLIELLVVIVIIGILAAIAIPVFSINAARPTTRR